MKKKIQFKTFSRIYKCMDIQRNNIGIVYCMWYTVYSIPIIKKLKSY